jgi:hypothetical protein
MISYIEFISLVYNIQLILQGGLMGYLVCNKCHGYYELQEGENPDDFLDNCECGGSLNYVQNLDSQLDEPDSVKVTECKADKPNSYFQRFVSSFDLRAIVIGLIAVFVLVISIKLLFVPDIRYLYLCIAGIFIGGLIAGYFSKKGFKNGGINGASVGLIFYFVNALFVIWFLFFPDQSWLDSNITLPQTGQNLLILSLIVSFIYAIFGGIIGAIGGIIGNIFSKKV